MAYTLARSLPIFLLLAGTTLRADPAPPANPAPPLGALAKMPVTEVTIFKDGHALLLHSGKMPTDAAGNVVLDYLPTPVLGTFWSATAEKTARLNSVTASQHRVSVTHTALSIRELLEANIGADVLLKEIPDAPGAHASPEITGTILGIPERSSEELEATSPTNAPLQLPVKGNILLLKTDSGTRAIDINRVEEVTFKGDHKTTLASEELRNLLTLKLNWQNNQPQKTADVSLMYLQKGIRWIPSYKITLDGNGTATVKMQATLINEMVDLKDVTASLVVGVPSFAFADATDPIALQQATAQLSAYFRPDLRTSNQFSNGIMTQAGQSSEAAANSPDLGPEIGEAKKNEDLFIFTLNHLTLKKGDRMVMPIKEFKIAYKDVYKLDLPFTPPPEIWRQFQTRQQSEIARLAAAPKFMHCLRFDNQSDNPLTTAPALIIRNDKVLAQVMMTYTPIGGQTDVSMTTAIDITLKKSDKETKRTPNDQTYEGHEFFRVDLDGTIHITNHGAKKADLEITRNILGQLDKADHEGDVEMLNTFEDHSFEPTGQQAENPYWWSWASWPAWWSHFNSIGRITWKTTLDPNKSIDLGYTWHYYWR